MFEKSSSFEENIAHNININEMSTHFHILRQLERGNTNSNIQTSMKKGTMKETRNRGNQLC